MSDCAENALFISEPGICLIWRTGVESSLIRGGIQANQVSYQSVMSHLSFPIKIQIMYALARIHDLFPEGLKHTRMSFFFAFGWTSVF